MHISKLTVEHFCSIEHAEASPTMFNVLVGQNNHGKTNVFEALNWFYSGKGDIGKLRFSRQGTAEVVVEAEFSNVQAALAGMKNDRNRVSIEKVIGKADCIRAKRSSVDSKTRKIFDPASNHWLDKNPTGFDSAFNDLLPLLEYVDTSTHLNDVAKYTKTSPVGNMLAGVLMALLETSQPYKDFRQKFDDLFTAPGSDVRVELDTIGTNVTMYVAKQFPDCTKVTFQITEPAFEELLKGCTTEIDDGIVTSADEKGDGMQRALMLAILQTYADFRRKGEAIGKGFIFLIDEAELHLHPTAQRHLKLALKDIALGGDQVFINTHSSVLVADDFPQQTILCVEKCDKKSAITPVLPAGKPAIIYELLGGSPNDLLLPRNFLIVEGKSDQLFIKAVIERFYSHKPVIQIIFAEGNFEKQRESMNGINSVFSALAQNAIYKERLVVLCDKPSPQRVADFTNFKNAYSYLLTNDQLHALPVQSLEEYYAIPYRLTSDQVEERSREVGMKRELARHVGKAITQEELEQQMPVLVTALQKCWANAYT